MTCPGGQLGVTAGGGAEDRVRCFVAAFVTGASAEALRNTVRPAVERALSNRRAAREVPPGNYHVTLKFLGDIAGPEMVRALEAVAALDATASAGQVTAITGFPRLRGARLVAAELAHHRLLEGWWRALQHFLGTEDRSFRPHVTVLRLQRPQSLTPVVLPEPLALDLEAPALYASDRTREGAFYRRVSLG